MNSLKKLANDIDQNDLINVDKCGLGRELFKSYYLEGIFELYQKNNCFDAIQKILTELHNCNTNQEYCYDYKSCIIHDNFFDPINNQFSLPLVLNNILEELNK